MSATKQQELDTLQTIRTMIEGLGSDSYLAIAFDGCLEDAERNIRFDAAHSMKGRYEGAQQEVERLRKQVNARITTQALLQLLEDRQNELVETISDAEQDIIKYAESPGSTEFIDAVKRHRGAKAEYAAIAKRFNGATDIR